MKFRTLIRRSLRFHWRSHLGVVLGAAIGSAALIGALVVGDSVRGSLQSQGLLRIGQTQLAMSGGDRLFRSELAAQLQTQLRDRNSQPVGVTPVLQTVASVTTGANEGRLNHVQVIGQSEGFGRLAPRTNPEFDWPAEMVGINRAVATALNVTTGATLVLRLPKPAALNPEVAVAQKSEATVALRVTVAEVVESDAWGQYDLRNSGITPYNIFIPLSRLQNALGLEDQANAILVGGNLPGEEATRYASFLQSSATAALAEVWQLADTQSALRTATDNSFLELRTSRIFLDPPLERAATVNHPIAQPLLTYLATLLRTGTNATPYSMVTAAGAPWTPADLRDDEIVVSQWLADDLHVKPGDEIALSYFLPESGAKLEEATNTFRVHSIVPMEMPWADRTLMPDFPGIEKAESTSEWDAGFPLTYEIRKKDDDYWKQYRGTPKAFITLAAGQKMWGNRFGHLTAIRFPLPSGSSGRESAPPETGDDQSRLASAATVEDYRAALEHKILAHLKPEELGLRFEPVREQALKAAREAQDFGGLFLGFSFFLIIAALLLMALLFQFGLEQRAPEIGTLLALGFTPQQVRKLLLREGLMLAGLGGSGGAVGGIYFAKAMLHGLNTAWNEAVGGMALDFHVTGPTLGMGVLASVIVATLTIWLGLRKFVQRPARELLVGEIQADESKVQSLKSKVIATAALVAGLALVGWATARGDTQNAGIFFGAGALGLIAGLSFVSAWLSHLTGAPNSGSVRSETPPRSADQEIRAPLTTTALAVRGCARRRKRSLATVAMLASGSFLIISIGVFRLDANRDATQKASGTGGFALWGEATIPVVQDLNTESGRDFFALSERDLAGVNVVSFRVQAGEEASCLNLNRAQKPRLLGVKPEALGGRFTIAKGESWQKLKAEIPSSASEIEIAAIGDANSIQWAMGKKVGDTIDYVDERGQPFKVRIVGAVANSILQGQLIIDEAALIQRFPSASGYRAFLVEAPSNSGPTVAATLTRALQDVGLELTPTVVRLNQFNAVQNTYLGTFQVLGGLGLLLGSVGLGVVVLRNVLERRSELAVLLAVGFPRAQVQRLVMWENGALLLAGLALGSGAAAVAVLPALLAPTGVLPYTSLALTLAAVLGNGWGWTWMATKLAVRGDLLAALRND